VTNPRFPTTRWTLIRQASDDSDRAARSALEELCRTYWHPVEAFLRQRGRSLHDAQDLTQAFFTALIAGPLFSRAAPERGRFRTLVLAALKNFVASAREREQAQKRGGGQVVVSWTRNDEGPRGEPSHDETPETIFERNWALSVLQRVLDRLADEARASGQAVLFAELKVVLTGGSQSYAEIAARLGRSEGSVKVAAHRLRSRYRALIRAEIAETVADEDIEDELRHLLAALSRG